MREVITSCARCHGRGTTVHGDRQCATCKGEQVVRTDPSKLAPMMVKILEVLETDADVQLAKGGWVAHGLSAGGIALRIGGLKLPRTGNHGSGNVSRQMSMATRVTPGITALRNRGLIQHAARPDQLSGSADKITEDGRRVLEALRSE